MSKFVVFGGWDDAPHLSAEAKAGLLKSYLPHERDARTKGIPSLGAGAIYPVPEEDILIDPFEFPAWFRHAYALDVGWNRTACLWGAYDPDNDVLYIYEEYYRAQAEPSIHATAIRRKGEWIPGVVDPAARGRSQKDGVSLFNDYIDLGLTLSAADNTVTGPESGLLSVWERMSTGGLRVFRTLQNWKTEFRIYRRSTKGAIVKENDHLMDCMRYLVKSGIDLSVVRPFEEWPGRPGMPNFKGTNGGKGLESDYNPMAHAWNVGDQSSDRMKTWVPGRGFPR